MRKGQEHIRLWAVAFWIVFWQLGSMALGQEILLPSPASVLLRLLVLVRTAAFWQSIAWSAGRILLGFAVACLLGTLCAILAARCTRIRELLSPLTAAVKATPVVSFIILALVWVKAKNLSPLIAGLMVFPILYGNVLTGIAQADRQLLEMAQVFRVSGLRVITEIYIPAILPHFRTACSLALGMCWKAGTAAEVIGLPKGSLGEHLYNSKIYLETADLFAWTVVIICVSVCLEKAFLWLLDRLAYSMGLEVP